jgi:hypothetical protein
VPFSSEFNFPFPFSSDHYCEESAFAVSAGVVKDKVGVLVGVMVGVGVAVTVGVNVLVAVSVNVALDSRVAKVCEGGS